MKVRIKGGTVQYFVFEETISGKRFIIDGCEYFNVRNKALYVCEDIAKGGDYEMRLIGTLTYEEAMASPLPDRTY